PIAAGTRTLHAFQEFRFALYPRRGGRAPELDDPNTLEWLGRFIGRIHSVGALSPFVRRPALDIATFGEEPREYLLGNDSLTAVRAGYEDFFDFGRRELHLLEALRTLRMIHYSAWLARRWNDPAFPAAFPWFHTTKYWQDQILQLREQVAATQDSPLGPL